MEFTGYNNANLTFSDTFNDSEIPQDAFGKDNVYNNVFRVHPAGHITRRKANVVSEQHENSTPEDLGAEAGDHGVGVVRSILQKAGANLVDNTEQVTEDVLQHKYSRLANSSYDYFNSKGSIDAVHDGLSDSKYDYIQDLKGFKADTELSTIDNLVLHNAETGETHVSYRGTTDNPTGATKSFFNDWKINGEISGGSTHSKRIQQADKQIDGIISKYGKGNLSVSGHSQGGHVSYEMAVKHDLRGFHYNPAINHTQLLKAGRYTENVSRQTVFKTPLDFASPMTYHKGLEKSNTKLSVVQNLEKMDGVVATHSIDQFAPTPKEILGDVVKVERRTMVSSLVKGAGHIAGVGMTAYTMGEDIRKDINNDNTVLEKTVDSTIDAGKTAEQFVVDGEIITASLALAPETMGLSLVAGLGGVVINDLVSGHVAKSMKQGVPKVGHAIKNTGNKIGRWFKKHF